MGPTGATARISVLLLLTLGLPGCGLFSGWFDESRAVARRAERLVADGKPDEAVEHVRGAIASLGSEDEETRYAHWMTLAGIHEQTGNTNAAVSAFEEAFETRAGDLSAAAKIANLLTSGSPGEVLQEFSRRFSSSGAVEPALKCLEHFLGGDRDAAATEQTLEDWVLLSSSGDLLDGTALERLPKNAEGLLDELTAIVRDPREAEVAQWTATPKRRHIISLAVQCLTEKRLVDLLPDDRDGLISIEALYDRARRLAPGTAEYRDDPELRSLRTDSHPGPPDAGFDIAVDLALFLQKNWRNFDDVAGGTLAAVGKLRNLMRGTEDPLHYENFQRTRRTKTERTDFNLLLGVVFGDLDLLQEEEDDERAIDFLQWAIEHSEDPLPKLRETLGRVYEFTGRSLDAKEQYVEASKEYEAQGDRSAANNALALAAALGLGPVEETAGVPGLIADVIGPEPGFYVGGGAGVMARHDDSQSGLAREIGKQGHAGIDVDLDSVEFGWRAALGYRFELPLSLELGYTFLRGPDSTINVATSNPGRSLQDDVEDEHPLTAHGVTLAAQGYILNNDLFDITLKAGVWLWDSDTKVTLNGMRQRIDRDGFDPIFGAGVQYRLAVPLHARLDYERYVIDGDEVDLFTMGMTYKF